MPKKQVSRAPITKNKSPRGVEQDESVDLKTAPPVQRMRGQLERLRKKLAWQGAALGRWADNNEAPQEARQIMDDILERFFDLQASLTKLADGGFSPPRKAYTSKMRPGDHLKVLPKYCYLYTEIMDEKLMSDLTALKVYPSKGGVVVRATDSCRMKVARAHVVKVS